MWVFYSGVWTGCLISSLVVKLPNSVLKVTWFSVGWYGGLVLLSALVWVANRVEVRRKEPST